MKRIVFVIVILASVVLSQAQTFDYPIRVVNGQEVYEYPVQKSEGLYRISVNFGVTQEELIKLNPELKTTGLKYGQTILVPVKRNQAPPKDSALPLAKRDTVVPVKADTMPRLKKEVFTKGEVPAKRVPLDEKQDVMPMPLPKQAFKQGNPKPEEEVFFEEDTMFVLEAEPVGQSHVLRLALLLPLQADAQMYDVRMERFLKFYEGVLLGLREEKRTDWKFEVYVYDVGKTEYKLRKTLALPEMAKMNAIIGPAYSEQIPAASEFMKQHGIICLLPFTNGVDGLESNKYLLQYNPAVPEGMRVVQFKREVDGNWADFDGLMSTYFGVHAPSQSRPRYDILGYDLTKYFVPAVLNALQAENDEAWQRALETEYDGLQSTMRFQRVGEGGFMNTPLRVMPRVTATSSETNDEQK
ncbi:MAG: LysM peptidoglycan-binding domain-containing protein [Paludibacteraceae bacterium]|nr:LysM peptidoglycan-binding domain-containing protein [Paludibacteraceae bacterium]